MDPMEGLRAAMRAVDAYYQERGIFQERFGGFVDPSCLMLNKVTCEAVLPLWNCPLRNDPKAMSADRNVFNALSRHFRVAGTDQPTVFYRLDPEDGLQPLRRKLIGPAYDECG